MAWGVFLALLLIIGAFLACILGAVASMAFLPAIYEWVFYIASTGAASVLEPISLLSSTLLGVALCLYFNGFGLYLIGLSFTSNLAFTVIKTFS